MVLFLGRKQADGSSPAGLGCDEELFERYKAVTAQDVEAEVPLPGANFLNLCAWRRPCPAVPPPV